MTTLERTLDLEEALRLKICLEKAGIPAHIPNEPLFQTYRGPAFIPGGLRVEVDSEDLPRAKPVLTAFYRR